jgi:hypothetical protein
MTRDILYVENNTQHALIPERQRVLRPPEVPAEEQPRVTPIFYTEDSPNRPRCSTCGRIPATEERSDLCAFCWLNLRLQMNCKIWLVTGAYTDNMYVGAQAFIIRHPDGGYGARDLYWVVRLNHNFLLDFAGGGFHLSAILKDHRLLFRSRYDYRILGIEPYPCLSQTNTLEALGAVHE